MGTSEGPPAAAGAAKDAPPPELPQTKAEVQARREALRSALVALEDALSSPAGHPASWTHKVQAAVEQMATTLQHHVRDTESEGGLLVQLEEDAPWLEGRVEQLRREHDQLLSRTDALLGHCRRADTPDELRTETLELLRAISRHRQQGTDLLYDAYMVDITAAD